MYIFSYISQIKYSYIREHLLRMCVLLARTVASYARTHSLSQSHSRRKVTKSRKFACCDFV